jgi:hypothetical protein
MTPSISVQVAEVVLSIARLARRYPRELRRAGEAWWSVIESQVYVHELRRVDGISAELRMLEFARSRILDPSCPVPEEVESSSSWAGSLELMRDHEARFGDLAKLSAKEVTVRSRCEALPDDLSLLGYGPLNLEEAEDLLECRLDATVRPPDSRVAFQLYSLLLSEEIAKGDVPRTAVGWWQVTALVLLSEAAEFDMHALGVGQEIELSNEHSSHEEWRVELLSCTPAVDSCGNRTDEYLQFVKLLAVNLARIEEDSSHPTRLKPGQSESHSHPRAPGCQEARLQGEQAPAPSTQTRTHRGGNSPPSGSGKRRRASGPPPNGWFWAVDALERYGVPKQTAYSWTEEWGADDRFVEEEINVLRIRCAPFEELMKTKGRVIPGDESSDLTRSE